MTNVILLHTVRGGKDPDEYWHVLEKGLADTLDELDPWKTLNDLEDEADPRILASFLVSRIQAAEWCAKNNAKIVGDMEAEGY